MIGNLLRPTVVFAFVPIVWASVFLAPKHTSGEELDASDQSQSASVVVVCPDAFVESMAPWIDRRKNDGLKVTLIASSARAGDLRDQIRAQCDDRTRYLVLVGDAPAIGTACDPTKQIPTMYASTTVTAKWGSTKTMATDFPYGDLDDDGIPELSVGRLPVDDAPSLEKLIERIIAYESSDDFGDWRNRVQLVGGVGGFGAFADSAIESVTRTVITSVLPRETQTCVAYASEGHPFCPEGASFTDSIVNRYTSGCRFWVYAGHGQVTELDRFPRTAEGKPVLDRKTLRLLNAGHHRAPIALLLCCFTGAFDASEDSFSENLLLHDGGPIAVLSGSRVTMPYGNATAAVGLISGVYEKRMPRLGDAWLVALQQMTAAEDAKKSSVRTMIDSLAMMISPKGTKLADERAEHTQLYCLLGDPTLRLQPPQSIEVDAQTGYNKGEPVTVKLTSPIEGPLVLSCHYPLGSPLADGDPNETQFLETTVAVKAGQSTPVSLSIPDNVLGSVIIRAHLAGQSSWAVGAAQSNIRP